MQAWGLWEQNKTIELLDTAISLPLSESEPELLSELKRCIQIGLLSVQDIPSDRPTMSTIVAMLTSTASLINRPGRPTMDNTAMHSSHELESNLSSPSTDDLT